MTEYCPRGSGPDSPFKAPFNGEMHWYHTAGVEICSYCGSLHPDKLMECLEANPPAQITPTDKTYKIYVRGHNLPSNAKFYFQHFSMEQRQRFVELLNEKKINFAAPGYFYVKPYFIEYVQ